MKAVTPAHPGYRGDIDGLRALAVLSVIAFHAFPALFPGGFIGVDIFFVISGYLITGILLDGLIERRFSFLEFYRRRIQRIFPALILVLAACLAVGWYALIDDEFHDLARHALSGAGFTSNLLLWHIDVYFDARAESQPLRHLWSLAVEEQFYIAWPIVLWLTWRLRLNATVVICVLAIGSFALNVTDSFSAQFVKTLIAFASLQTRAWELLLGGLLAHITRIHGGLLPFMSRFGAVPESKRSSDVLATAGMVLLAVGFVGITPHSLFPGIWALLPTLGTFLVIAAGSRAWLNGTVLASRPCRFIGLISYPLYLWHWPLLSFARVLTGATPAVGMCLALIAAAVLLAWLTYQTVERPIRSGTRRPLKAILLLATMAVVGSAAYAGLRYDPLDARPLLRQLADVVRRSALPGYDMCREPQLLQGPRLSVCTENERGGTNAALIGDSHAEDKFFGFVNIDHEHTWALLANAFCPPIYGINLYVLGDPESSCRQKSAKIIDWVDSQPPIKLVVLAFFGNYFLTTPYAADHVLHDTGPNHVAISGLDGQSGASRSELFFSGLEQAVAQLEQAGKQVIVPIDLPEFPFLPRDCYRRHDKHGCVLPRSAVDARQADERAIIARLQRAHPGIRVFDPLERFCTDSECFYTESGQLLYEDSNHLTHYGSELYAQAFIGWLGKF
jgi:peptidoglycan/LPS O-acetylase OafA/YrhL